MRVERQRPSLILDAQFSLRFGVMGDKIASIAASNGWIGVVFVGSFQECLGIDAVDIGAKALGMTAAYECLVIIF